jgi:hypothetical protein
MKGLKQLERVDLRGCGGYQDKIIYGEVVMMVNHWTHLSQLILCRNSMEMMELERVLELFEDKHHIQLEIV